MNSLTHLVRLCAGILIFGVTSAYGNTYAYSYTFSGANGAGVVTGNFDGDLLFNQTNLIYNISNASVFLNGVSIDTGAGIFVERYSGVGPYGLDQQYSFKQPIVAIDGINSDFIFFNSDRKNGVFDPYTNAYFTIDYFGSPDVYAEAYGVGLSNVINPSLSQGSAWDRPIVTSGWKVTDITPRSVPDSTYTLALLGAALFILALVRSELKASAPIAVVRPLDARN